MTNKDKEDIIKQFFHQCIWIRTVRNEFKTLYGCGEKRLKLLNEVAKHFFAFLNRILDEYILLKICAITDPPASHRKDNNITVKYILNLIGPEDSKKLGLDELSEKIHSIRDCIVPARNKIIAHLDKDAFLSSQKRWGEFSDDDEESFWNNLQEFVNRINNYYFKNGIFPILEPVVSDGAKGLVGSLKYAVRYKELLLENKGTWAFDELKKMPYKDA
jgi:hypothetical protein